MKLKYLRKFIISATAIAFTAATVITSTYAWIVVSNVSELREFEFHADEAYGLQVSLDGKKFSQDITLEDLKSVIERNTSSVYGEERYVPVTLSQDADGKVEFLPNGLPKMVKDHISEYTSAEKQAQGIPSEIDYYHTYQDAYTYDANTDDYYSEDFLFFDVYFRLATNGNQNDVYDLYFKNYKDDTRKPVGITGTAIDLELSNTLTTPTGTYGPYETDPDFRHIVVNPQDAMRLAVKNHSNNEFTIYEENIGLGSAAIEGSTDPLHDKTKNAMFTLYNDLYPSSPLTTAALNGDAYNTVKNTTDESGEKVNCYSISPIHAFENTNGHYEDVKITFVIWLEGWDADYFDGITDRTGMYDPNKMFINLSFEAKKR